MTTNLSSSRVVVHNAVYSLLGYAVSAIYIVLLVPLVVGYVGLQIFGLWSLMMALTGYLGLVDLGLGTSFVKYIAEYASQGDHGTVGKVVQHGFVFYMLAAFLMVVVGWVAFPFLFSALRIPSDQYDLAKDMFFLSLLAFGATSVVTVVGSVLVGTQRNDAYNVVLAASLVVKYIVIAVVLYLGFGILGLMVSDLLVTLILVAPLWLAIRRTYPQLAYARFSFDGTLMKKLMGFGAQLQISRLADIVQSQFDKLLLTRFIGLSAVSLYDFGSRPLNRLRALPLTGASALLPAVAALEAADNPERIQAAFHRATRYVILLALPLFAYLSCFAGDLIAVWLGPGFDQSALTLRILTIGFYVNVIASPLSYVSQGKGEPKYQMKAMLIQVFLNVALSTGLILRYGYFGAVAGTATAMTIGTLIFFWWYGKSFLVHPMRVLINANVKPFLCVIPAVLLGMGVRWAMASLVFNQSRVHLALILGGTCIVFILVYGMMVHFAGMLTEDDRGFIAGVLPERLKPLLRFL